MANVKPKLGEVKEFASAEFSNTESDSQCKNGVCFITKNCLNGNCKEASLPRKDMNAAAKPKPAAAAPKTMSQ